MRLIDEIEAAAAVWEKDSASAAEIVESQWWQRLKAALLAGEELSECLRIMEALGVPMPSKVGVERDRFRAATEGTDAAAIGRAS